MSLLNPLIDELHAPDNNTRVAAALALGKSGDEAALAPLLAALWAEPDDYVRETLTWAIVKFGALAVPPLAQMTQHADAHLRHQAVHVLGKIGGASAVAPLVTALNDSNPTVQIKAAFSLGQIGDVRAIPALIGQFGAANLNVQNSVNAALERFGANAVDALAETLTTPRWHSRKQAAEVLALIAHPRAIPALTQSLSDEHAEVRFAAISALCEIGTPDTKSAVRPSLADPDPRVQAMARQHLKS